MNGQGFSWWESVLLWFIPSKRHADVSMEEITVVTVKNMFGKIYVMKTETMKNPEGLRGAEYLCKFIDEMATAPEGE